MLIDCDCVVTLLSILACNAIAVPLSPAFPVGELKYIMDNSQASVLLSTEKFADKARELVQTGLAREPALDIMGKIRVGGTAPGRIEVEDVRQDSLGGMMLYTSGTTSRPVCTSLARPYSGRLTRAERRPHPAIGAVGAGIVASGSVAVQPRRPAAASAAAAPHPRDGECDSGAGRGGLVHRVHVPV